MPPKKQLKSLIARHLKATETITSTKMITEEVQVKKKFIVAGQELSTTGLKLRTLEAENMKISNKSELLGELDVSGASTFKDDVRFKKNVMIDGDLSVDGLVKIEEIHYTKMNTTQTDNDLDISGNLQVTENLRVDKDVSVGGKLDLSGNVDVSGNGNILGSLTVSSIHILKPEESTGIISIRGYPEDISKNALEDTYGVTKGEKRSEGSIIYDTSQNIFYGAARNQQENLDFRPLGYSFFRQNLEGQPPEPFFRPLGFGGGDFLFAWAQPQKRGHV